MSDSEERSAPEWEIMPEDGERAREWTEGVVRDEATGEARHLRMPGKASANDAKRTFLGLQHARESIAEWFVDSLNESINNPRTLTGPVAALFSARLLGVYSALAEAEIEDNNRDAFEDTRLVTIEDNTAEFDTDLANELTERLVKSPPSWLADLITSEILPHYREEVDLGEWMATHIVYWARRDMLDDLGDDVAGMDDDTFADELEQRVFNGDGRYFGDALEILVSELGDIVWGALKESDEFDTLTPLRVEKLLGLHDEPPEDNFPRPKPKPEDFAPSPFQGKGNNALMLSDTFSSRVTLAIMDARDKPAPTYNGEWGADHAGNPVRVEQLGNPYSGRAILQVHAYGEPDPTAVEAKMGWAMMERMNMRTVWLHLLLLSQASAPHRRGERDHIIIPRRRVEKWLGLQNRRYSAADRAKTVREHVEALQSVFVQFQSVERKGETLHFEGDLTAAPLWNVRMKGTGQRDLFAGGTSWDWTLVAKEGLWASEFLHAHGDQWAPLPESWLDAIDRRGNDFEERLAVFLLFHFRINRKRGGRVKLQAQNMLDICGADLTKRRTSRERNTLKTGLSGALDALRERYGVHVQDEGVHMERGGKGVRWEDWKVRTASFDPPDVMDGALLRGDDPPMPALPEVQAGNWTAAQVRRLRKKLGWNQGDLAERLGVSKQMVSHYENHRRTVAEDKRKILDRLHARHLM